jgi:hypothetical protein
MSYNTTLQVHNHNPIISYSAPQGVLHRTFVYPERGRRKFLRNADLLNKLHGVTPRHTSHHTMPCNTTPCHITQHHTTPHPTPRHATSHHSTPHRTPHHATSHHTTSHHTTVSHTTTHHNTPHTTHHTTHHTTPQIVATYIPVVLMEKQGYPFKRPRRSSGL